MIFLYISKNKITMKFDIKTIIILVLLGFSLLFGYKWFFSADPSLKKRLKEIEAEYNALEEKKKESDKKIKQLEQEYVELEKKDKQLQQQVIKLESEIKVAEQTAANSKSNLDKMKKDLAETKHKIEEFKKNPPNRTGDDLLNSLKNKTQK